MSMAMRKMLLAASVALNLLLLWAVLFGDNGFVGYRNLKEESADLRLRIEALKTRNLALSNEIRLLKADKNYLEHAIRKRLNFVRDNEIWYIFPEKQDQQSGEGKNETKD